MHTFIKHRDGQNSLYTVGFATKDFFKDFDRVVGWIPIEDVKTKEEAMRLVNYLNGGNK